MLSTCPEETFFGNMNKLSDRQREIIQTIESMCKSNKSYRKVKRELIIPPEPSNLFFLHFYEITNVFRITLLYNKAKGNQFYKSSHIYFPLSGNKKKTRIDIQFYKNPLIASIPEKAKVLKICKGKPRRCSYQNMDGLIDLKDICTNFCQHFAGTFLTELFAEMATFEIKQSELLKTRMGIEIKVSLFASSTCIDELNELITVWKNLNADEYNKLFRDYRIYVIYNSVIFWFERNVYNPKRTALPKEEAKKNPLTRKIP